jgi:hypothetical protein
MKRSKLNGDSRGRMEKDNDKKEGKENIDPRGLWFEEIRW